MSSAALFRPIFLAAQDEINFVSDERKPAVRTRVIHELGILIANCEDQPRHFKIWRELFCFRGVLQIRNGEPERAVADFAPLLRKGGKLEHVARAHIVYVTALKEADRHRKAKNHLWWTLRTGSTLVCNPSLRRVYKEIMGRDRFSPSFPAPATSSTPSGLHLSVR